MFHFTIYSALPHQQSKDSQSEQQSEIRPDYTCYSCSNEELLYSQVVSQFGYNLGENLIKKSSAVSTHRPTTRIGAYCQSSSSRTAAPKHFPLQTRSPNFSSINTYFCRRLFCLVRESKCKCSLRGFLFWQNRPVWNHIFPWKWQM